MSLYECAGCGQVREEDCTMPVRCPDCGGEWYPASLEPQDRCLMHHEPEPCGWCASLDAG